MGLRKTVLTIPPRHKQVKVSLGAFQDRLRERDAVGGLGMRTLQVKGYCVQRLKVKILQALAVTPETGRHRLRFAAYA